MRSLPLVLALAACTPPRPAAAPQTLTLAIIGDRTGEPDDAIWRSVLTEVEGFHTDRVVTVGDLADDCLDPQDWGRALEATRVLTAPIEFTPGNHDIEDAATAIAFAERTGQAHYRSVDVPGAHLVIVDNAVGERWEDLDVAQRIWLAGDLAEHEGETILVFMHKPFWATGVGAGRPDPMHELFVANGVRAVFTGHWHAQAHERIDGIDYLLVGSSGGGLSGLPDPRRGTAPEWVLATLTDGTLDLKVMVDGAARPVDELRLADRNALYGLVNGRIRGRLVPGETDRLLVHVENPSDGPLETTLEVAGGAWSDASLPVRVGPGETFEGEVVLARGEAALPLPRIRLEVPLPAAGPTPFEAVVDHAREVLVPWGGAPTLDGTVASGEWDGAVTLTAFTNALGEAAGTDPTAVHLRHDGEALYLAALCADHDAAAMKHIHGGRDGHVVYDDRIGLTLSPDPDHLFWFYVTPDGAIWDLAAGPDGVSLDWDAVEAASTHGDWGWTTEVRVPFAAMGLDTPPETWGFDLRRKQERRQAEATFTPAFGFTNTERMGVMRLGAPPR